MNNAQRKRIDLILDDLETIKILIEELHQEEEEKYNNMPENMQYGEKGEALNQGVEDLSQATYSIDEVIDYIVNAKGQ